MLNISLAFFIISLVSALMGSIGTGYVSSGILGNFALATLALAVVSLLRGVVTARRKRRLRD